jgi:hypothetical protein
MSRETFLKLQRGAIAAVLRYYYRHGRRRPSYGTLRGPRGAIWISFDVTTTVGCRELSRKPKVAVIGTDKHHRQSAEGGRDQARPRSTQELDDFHPVTCERFDALSVGTELTVVFNL